MPVITTIMGREIEPGHEIKSNGRWYVVESIGAPVPLDGRAVRAVRARTASTGHEAAPFAITDDAEYPRRVRRASAGRPDMGRPTTLRLDDAARDALRAAKRPDESLADTVRRLLGVALDPALPDLLNAAMDHCEESADAWCRDCERSGRKCPDHEPYGGMARVARRLLGALGTENEVTR